MSTLNLDAIIGADKVPNFRGRIPAAWWITTDPAQLDAYDQWAADRDASHAKIRALEESLGLPDGSGRISSFAGSTVLVGFVPTREMTFWSGHPDAAPVPTGWRIDSKKNYLVPVRRTKKDRENQVNKDFAAVQRVPDVGAYLSGMPDFISLNDRQEGGTWYGIQYRRGNACVMAFCGGDPIRADEPVKIDESVWQQQKLSALLTLVEARDGERA